MKIIGLTGGIGSGKTTVLKLFKKLGFETYIADERAKYLMVTNKELKAAIINLIGPNAYKDGILNNKYIASLVFSDKEKLNRLNTLVHPVVKGDFKIFVSNSKAKNILYEAAILFESGGNEICDYTITVTADKKNRIERIMKRDKVSKESVLDRMQHQTNDAYKIKKSTFVISNNNLERTNQQVLTIFKILEKLENR